MHQAVNGTRAIALVGPAGAGKTCLAEAMLFASGTIDRQGDTAAKNSVGTRAMTSCPSRPKVGMPVMTRIWLRPATRKNETMKQLPAPNSRSMSM